LLIATKLNRPDLAASCLNTAERSLPGDILPYNERLTQMLISHGRGPRVEAHLIKLLQSAMSGKQFISPPQGGQIAVALVKLYFGLGRYKDVVTLLERFPGWDAPDLRGLASPGDDEPSDLMIAAKSLGQVGRTEEARRILRYDIDLHPSNDHEYSLLLDLDPINAAITISRLKEEFPLEPRPFIWSAVRLMRVGQFVAAESEVRHAISMDPDDLEGLG
jgi:hypothetical protein